MCGDACISRPGRLLAKVLVHMVHVPMLLAASFCAVHAMDDRQTCIAFFTLQQAVLGVLLPVLAASWVPRPALPPSPERAAASGAQPDRQQQQEEEEEEQQQQPNKGLWHRAVCSRTAAYESAAEACERADDLLTKACRAVEMPTWRHLVGFWILCCEFWLFAKILATNST